MNIDDKIKKLQECIDQRLEYDNEKIHIITRASEVNQMKCIRSANTRAF